MLNIYLADLANDFIEIDNKTIPIGIGYIGAYCKSLFKDDIDLSIFRTLKPLLEKTKQRSPDIVGFGSYNWNYNLSIKASNIIRKEFPQCMIVFGGPNVASDIEENRKFLRENVCIDFLVFSDGEFPFSNLVQLMLQFRGKPEPIKKIKSMHIDGVRTLYGETVNMGKPDNIVRNLDDLPSPYLTGLFDELLKNELLVPIIQNVRGCPYRCTFCVSGSQPKAIRSFPFERVAKEIDYLRDNAKSLMLRFSDDNFGILKGDLRVAEYLKGSYDNRHYPRGVRVYLSKELNDRTMQISEILKKLTLMNISFQSITPDVMKNVERINMPLDIVTRSLEFARKNGIANGSELIFGLPGESLSSMKKVIDTGVELRFDSIALNILWLLRGSKVATPQIRDEYQYTSRFMLAENAITHMDDLLSIEVDEIAVSSKDFSFEDFKEFLQIQFLITGFVYYGYGRSLLYHALTFNIKASDLFQELLSNPQAYPVINSECGEYREKYLENLFYKEEEVIHFVRLNIDRWAQNKDDLSLPNNLRMITDSFVKLFFNDPAYSVFDEIARAIVVLYKGTQTGAFKELTYHIKDFCIKLLINPKAVFEEEVIFFSNYNISYWIKDGYLRPLSEYDLPKQKEFILRPINPEIIKYVQNKDIKENKNNCFNFFRYTISSDVHRVVVD